MRGNEGRENGVMINQWDGLRKEGGWWPRRDGLRERENVRGSIADVVQFVKMGRRPARCYRYCKNKP